MLGQSENFNAMICDYFNQSTGEVHFHMNCVNRETKYMLNNNGLTVGNQIFFVKASNPLHSEESLMIEMFSILPPELRQLSATFSVSLSPCFSGYTFNNINDTNICEC